MPDDTPFLGTGWSFPPAFVKGRASVVTVHGTDDIRESLQILLSTSLGERVMRPSYGCDLRIDLFDNLDNSLRAYLRDKVRTAILYHEPRIRLDDVSVQSNGLDGRVDISVTYTVQATNTRHNIVYPYYLEEGTETGT